MRLIIVSQLLISLTFGCVDDEEEDVLAYEYDLERLCIVDPDSPIKIATQEPRRPNQTTVVRPTCSIDEERRLVVFQRYFTEEFVDCYHVWEEVVYWEEIPGKTSISDLKCED